MSDRRPGEQLRRSKIVCVCDKAVGAPDLTLRGRPWPTNGGRARHDCNNARIVQNRTADGILKMRKDTRTFNQAPNIRFFFLARNCNRNITSRGFHRCTFLRSPPANLDSKKCPQLTCINYVVLHLPWPACFAFADMMRFAVALRGFRLAFSFCLSASVRWNTNNLRTLNDKP